MMKTQQTGWQGLKKWAAIAAIAGVLSGGFSERSDALIAAATATVAPAVGLVWFVVGGVGGVCSLGE